jgi:hypothetical protein
MLSSMPVQVWATRKILHLNDELVLGYGRLLAEMP